MDKIEAEKVSYVTFAEYIRLQTEIILSEENLEKARLSYGREVTRNEAADFFVTSGQAAEFSKKYKVINTSKLSSKN